MKFMWLESLVKEGSVRPEARDAIYKDCSEILKHAAGLPAGIPPPPIKNLNEWFAQYGGTAIQAGMLGLGALGVKTVGNLMKTRAENKALSTDLAVMALVIANHPELAAHKEKATARFNELIRIAPTVARNPELAARIIKEKVHSGFTSQDVQNLALIQASYTPDLSKQKALTEKMRTLSEKRAGETMATVVMMCKEAMKVPPQTRGGLKSETVKRVMENAAVLAAIPAILGVGTGIVNAAASRINKKELEAKLENSFQAAMRLGDPDKDSFVTQKEKARQAFQVLSHFSPHIALQPNAARSFMQKMVNYDEAGGVQIDDIKSMSEVEKNYRGGTSGISPFFAGLSAGSHATGLGEALKSSVSSLGKPLSKEIDLMASKDLGIYVEPNQQKNTQNYNS